MLNFMGVYGDVNDPAKTLDTAFAKADDEDSESKNSKVELLGSPKAYKPGGFSGALMKCQEAKVSATSGSSGNGPKSSTFQFASGPTTAPSASSVIRHRTVRSAARVCQPIKSLNSRPNSTTRRASRSSPSGTAHGVPGQAQLTGHP